MSCGPEIANHDLSFYLYIYCIPTYNLLMTAHLGYRRGVFWVCEIPWIYVFCYLFLKTGSCVLSVFSDRVAVITVSNSTISFSSQARQCHDGQLCDKRKISLHTINSRSKEDQQHDHLPPAITILTSDPPQTTRYLLYPLP